jgi:hypothetical protein
MNEGLSSLQRGGGRNVPLGHVSTRPLDDWVEREGLSRVDLIKIDVEGAERAVLEGASRTLERFRPSLILEWNEPAEDPVPPGPSLRRDLHAQGYTLFSVDPFGRASLVQGGAPIASPTVFARHESRL